MGQVWLTELDRWLINAGLDVSVYDDQWKTRARSSGGYERVLGIGIHHDASNPNSTDQSACDWAWKNSSDRPIGAIRLGRSGHITVGAAGATNTMGKGGPLTSTHGTIPRDQGNLYMVAIEAGNNGVGETWPRIQIEAYLLMVDTLCSHLGLAHSDVWSHAGYCAPSCPGRKIDPAGPAEGYPNLGPGTWPDKQFRGYLDALQPEPAPPPPSLEEDDMLFICSVGGTVYVGNGIVANEVPSSAMNTLKANVEGNGTARWRHPARTDLPILTRMSDIPEINGAQRDLLVGMVQ